MKFGKKEKYTYTNEAMIIFVSVDVHFSIPYSLKGKKERKKKTPMPKHNNSCSNSHKPYRQTYILTHEYITTLIISQTGNDFKVLFLCLFST